MIKAKPFVDRANRRTPLFPTSATNAKAMIRRLIKPKKTKDVLIIPPFLLN